MQLFRFKPPEEDHSAGVFFDRAISLSLERGEHHTPFTDLVVVKRAHGLTLVAVSEGARILADVKAGIF